MEVNIGENYQLMIIGKTGTGKSSILNSLVLEKKFPEGHGLGSKTMEVCEYSGPLPYDENQNNIYSVIDTPGFYCSEKKDNSHINNIINFLKSLKANGGINCIFFTIPLTDQRFDSSLQTSLNLIKTLLGEEVFKKLKVIHTFKNQINEKALKRSLERFKDLPELLRTSGFPIEGNLETFMYDYDEPEEFCKQIIQSVKNSPKFYPEVLDHLDNVDFDLTDPVKLYKNLVNNSKCISDLNDQLLNLKTVIENYEKQTLKFEEEKKYFKQQLEEKEKQIAKLFEQNKTASEESRKEINKMIENYSKQVGEINRTHLNAMEEMRIKNENENRRIMQEQNNFRAQQEKIRKESEQEMMRIHQENIKNLENKMNNLQLENERLRNVQPTVIHHYYDDDDDDFCSIF